MAVPEIAALDHDPRMQRLASLCDATLVPAHDRCDGHSIVIKHAGVSEGLADLPWHRDCGLGGHRVKCPNMQIGIQLERADADTGWLQFLAGSWGSSVHRLAVDRQGDLPIVAIEAAPGDCTLHFGDTLHAAPPPRAPGRGRRTLYSSFYAPHMHAVIGPGQSYNDVMLARDDGLVTALRR
jgi:ectoine hydroxylase-related dioxygenase (phytanoyl-CoA dioxygenase family)